MSRRASSRINIYIHVRCYAYKRETCYALVEWHKYFKHGNNNIVADVCGICSVAAKDSKSLTLTTNH